MTVDAQRVGLLGIERHRARVGAAIALAVGVGLLALAVVVGVAGQRPAAYVMGGAAVLATALAGLLLAPARRGHGTLETSDFHEPEAPVLAEDLLSLRCPSCASRFEVPDTHAEILETRCPACGASGRVRRARLVQVGAPEKTLRLRCGGCGALSTHPARPRPFEARCPACARRMAVRA